MTDSTRRSRRLFSSGRWQFQNRQPWAIIEECEDGSTSVNARHRTRKEAAEYLANGPSYSITTAEGTRYPIAERVEFDPSGWDAEPLTNPGNPLLADCRDEEDHTVSRQAIDWWLSMLRHWRDEGEGEPAPHEAHAWAVLTRYVAVFGVSD